MWSIAAPRLCSFCQKIQHQALSYSKIRLQLDVRRLYSAKINRKGISRGVHRKENTAFPNSGPDLKSRVTPLIVEMLSDDQGSLTTDQEQKLKLNRDIVELGDMLPTSLSELTVDLEPTTELNDQDQVTPDLQKHSQVQYVEEIALDIPQKWDSFEVSLPKNANIHGSSDKDEPKSEVPCPGCGALLHCQQAGTPGYMTSDKYKSAEDLRDTFCQRCHLMKQYNRALNVSVKPEEYTEIISQIKDVHALVIVVVDLMDLRNSLFKGLSKIIGEKRPVFIVGNKVDLIPKDAPGYLNRVKAALVKVCHEEGLYRDMYVHYVGLISAHTGYGIEELVTNLFSYWTRKGHVYLLGCTNVGKSTLFNALLMSDFCKAGAREYIHRATTSVWPGTTLNLLQFPIMTPQSWSIYERVQRLKADRKLQRVDASRPKSHFKALKGEVGQTFLGKRAQKVQQLGESVHGYDAAMFTYEPETDRILDGDRSQGALRQQVVGEREPYDEMRHVHSRWCYDTPGVINPEQVTNKLTQEELSLMLSKSVVKPRIFVMKPGQVMFVGGLGRLDYVQGAKSAFFTVLASSGLPVVIVESSDADDFYRRNLGTSVLGVPLGDRSRLSRLPSLIGRQLSVVGRGLRTSHSDVLLSSLGWVAVTADYGMAVELRAYTPGGVGISVREPALLPNLIKLRGTRRRGGSSYTLKVK